MAHEFVVALHRQPRSWLRLPNPFARVMEDNMPLGLWIRVDGCCNGPAWVVVELSPAGAMYLIQGWKSFACSRGLGSGHLPQFRFDESAMLPMKFFGASDYRMECCVESSSNSDFDSSSESDDDDSSPSIKSEGGDSD
nr:B3 domain-containing protein REM20-like [Aegilops tauschii subsp. strangulata]